MDTILEVRNICKYYGDLAANKNVSLKIRSGSVHAIIGENGAGKSTLMNMLSGVVAPTSGDILIRGKTQHFKSALDASHAGIGMVQQEFMLFPDLTVLENIVLGSEDLRGGCFLDLAASEKKVQKICEQYGFHFNLHAKARNLPIVMQQQVEIVKVLYREAEIIILDEPTAVLPPQEIEGLLNAIRFLIKQGKTVLFITHKLKEVLAVSDEITVMKLGEVVGSLPVSEATEAKLTNMMVGRDVMLRVEKDWTRTFDTTVLSIENLSVFGNHGVRKIRDVSLTLHAGEILGIVGVAGNGQTELIEAVTGTRSYQGTLRILGESYARTSPRQNRMAGMGYIPQDRIGEGCAQSSSLVENTIIGGHLKSFRKKKFLIDREAAESYTKGVVEKYQVKIGTLYDTAASLSGGNLQKLIVGREFSQGNRIVVIEDPTRGVDVGAIEFIWNEIVRQAERDQTAVLLISHDLNESMTLSDRILVLYDGMIQREFTGPDYDEKEIGLYMLGGERS